MGIVVPPSIAFIIFAVVASEFGSISITRLFIAAIRKLRRPRLQRHVLPLVND